MNDTEAAWLAGFLDGEGSLMVLRTVRRKYVSYVPAISATSTTPALVQTVYRLCGGKVSKPFQPKGNSKTAQVWMLTGKRVGPVLRKVSPYLVAKRQQAELLIVLREDISDRAHPGVSRFVTDPEKHRRREEIWLKVKALNRRGRNA